MPVGERMSGDIAGYAAKITGGDRVGDEDKASCREGGYVPLVLV